MDTPGIHKAKNKLGTYMVNVAERTLNEVDVVLWLVEPSTFIGAGEQHIAEQLKKVHTPVILVINKVDKIKREELLPCIAKYKDIYDFCGDLFRSAQENGENTDELVKVILQYLRTDHSFTMRYGDGPAERQIVAELIREKHCTA
mgnify:CR=1 FL=1